MVLIIFNSYLSRWQIRELWESIPKFKSDLFSTFLDILNHDKQKGCQKIKF